MKEIKICYNITNGTGLREVNLPTYFFLPNGNSFIDEVEQERIEIKIGFAFYSEQDFREEEIRIIHDTYIIIGNNTVSTRIIRNLDEKDKKQALYVLSKIYSETSSYSSESLKILDKYLNVFLEQLVE